MSPPTNFGNQARPARSSFFDALRSKWGMKIGRIEQLLITPCSSDGPLDTAKHVFIWAGAFFAGIPEAIATLNTHDCSDNLYDKAKQAYGPAAGRGGGRHGRRGTPNNSGGQRLPGTAPPASGWQQAGFRFGDVLEKIGAKIMVIDAALNLAINWQSFYLEWTGCGAPPAVYTTATVPNNVQGPPARERRSDLIGHPGSVGIICGIGGFATTVPVGQLEMAGTVPDEPFMWFRYESIQGTYWIVDAAGGADPPPLDQNNGSNANAAGGTNHWNRASMATLASTNRTGSVIIMTQATEGVASIISENAIVTISGENAGLLTSDGKADPCSNLPLTGTSVRR